MFRTIILVLTILVLALSLAAPVTAYAADSGGVIEAYEPTELPRRFRVKPTSLRLAAGNTSVIAVGSVTTLVGGVGMIASVIVLNRGGIEGLTALATGILSAGVIATGLVITVVGVRSFAHERGVRLRLGPTRGLLEGTF